MAPDFVLELRDVSSLTEARFAAGEGFTHIRLSPSLADGSEAAILEIKAFLSGIAVGIVGSESTKPHWAEYVVEDDCVVQNSTRKELSEAPKTSTIWVCASLEGQLPSNLSVLAGASLPGLEEYKTGFADYEPHQDYLEKLREKLEA